MPKDLDVNAADLPPSGQETQDVAPAPAEGDAQSSSATDVAESTTLSIVRDVVAKKEEADPQGSSPDAEKEGADTPEPDTEQTTEASETEGEQPEEDDESKYPKRAQKRIRELVATNKTLEADAGRYRNVETFLKDNGLAPDEAADGLQMMALAKTNPVEAWARIKPWVEKVAVAAGVIMPSDLQQRVQQGHLTREDALELSQTRARLGAAEAQRQFGQQRVEAQQREAYQGAIVNAAASWEQDRRVKDPNFEAKLPALQREIAFLQMNEGRPTTPDAVKDQCKRAYEAVNAQFRPAQSPAPSARKPAVSPVSGGQVAGNPAPKLESTLDIIRANRLRA